MTSQTLADGRSVVVFDDEAAMSKKLIEDVTAAANEAIAKKGSFSLCIPAGSIVAALKDLSPNAVDWSKVNVFFTGERLGQNKSSSAAKEAFCKKCNIKNVFPPLIRPLFSNEGSLPLPQFAVDEAAGAYTSLLKAHPAIDNSGSLPSFDLLLLGVGEDGHCGSLHPKKEHIKAAGNGTITFGICAPDKNQIALSMDVFCAAKKVILGATGPKKKEAVRRALSGDYEPHDCPAGLVKAAETVWYADKASMGDFTPK
jgi:6-phosphogluconolactonase